MRLRLLLLLVLRVLEYLARLSVEDLSRLWTVLSGSRVLLRVLEDLARLTAVTSAGRRTTASTTRVRRIHWPVRPHRAVGQLRRARVLLRRRTHTWLLRRASRRRSWRMMRDEAPTLAWRRDGSLTARVELLGARWRNSWRILLGLVRG